MFLNGDDNWMDEVLETRRDLFPEDSLVFKLGRSIGNDMHVWEFYCTGSATIIYGKVIEALDNRMMPCIQDSNGNYLSVNGGNNFYFSPNSLGIPIFGYSLITKF